MKDLRILISNTALPSKKIGSWTTRVTKFITKNPNFFDYVLSPSKQTEQNIYCKKKHFFTWNLKVRKYLLEYWVAKDFLKQIIELSKKVNKITIVILDDTHLIEAILLIKKKIKCEIVIVFSFHGYSLNLRESILNKIDKILFLTELSYIDALKKYESFVPEVEIIGNGVDSSLFFPLKDLEKVRQKKDLGFNFEDQIICWMSNSRRKKGLNIFIRFIDKVNKLNLPLKFLIIGSNTNINKENVINIGRIPNAEIPKYLQISDYYVFTSLWKEGFGLSLVESIKCGAKIITSNNGGIPEVISGLHNITVVDKPNMLENWLLAFKKSYNSKKENITIEKASSIWSYEDWEEKFKKSLL